MMVGIDFRAFMMLCTYLHFLSTIEVSLESTDTAIQILALRGFQPKVRCIAKLKNNMVATDFRS